MYVFNERPFMTDSIRIQAPPGVTHPRKNKFCKMNIRTPPEFCLYFPENSGLRAIFT